MDEYILNQLTWQNIKDIVEIADEILEQKEKKELVMMGEQRYYTAVLDKFKEYQWQLAHTKQTPTVPSIYDNKK